MKKGIIPLLAVLLFVVSCTESAKIEATSIELSTHELPLDRGASEILTVTFNPSNTTDKNLTWVSTNPDVATVNDGVVVGMSIGQADIIVKSVNLSDKCVVTVSVPFNKVDMGFTMTAKDGHIYKVYWGECNLGASSPYENGDSYAWGEITTKTDYSDKTYKWYLDGDNEKTIKYGVAPCSHKDYIDNKTVLELEDDAAHMNLGGAWRIPTEEETKQLLSLCDWTYTIKNGVEGYVAKSKVNNNELFIPFSKRFFKTKEENQGGGILFWTSSLNYDEDEEGIEYMSTAGGGPRPSPIIVDRQVVGYDAPYYPGGGYRQFGHPVRPVYEESIE